MQLRFKFVCNIFLEPFKEELILNLPLADKLLVTQITRFERVCSQTDCSSDRPLNVALNFELD